MATAARSASKWTMSLASCLTKACPRPRTSIAIQRKAVRAPDGTESRILVRGNWNTDIVPALKPETRDVVLYKPRFSGFYQTDLDTILKKLGIKHLIITGCTTSVCVEATVRDAMFRDYSCVLLDDCMSQPTLGNSLPGSSHDASLVVLVEGWFGWVSGSDEFIGALRAA